jgi:hypothetical protein
VGRSTGGGRRGELVVWPLEEWQGLLSLGWVVDIWSFRLLFFMILEEKKYVFKEEKMKAQRGEVICPGLHNCSLAEMELSPRLIEM